MLCTQSLPIFLLTLGEHENNVHLLVGLMKGLQRAHQNRHTTDGKVLLGHISPHPQPLTACDDDDVSFHN